MVMHAIHVHERWGGSNADVSGTKTDSAGPSKPTTSVFVLIAQQCEGPPGKRSRFKQDMGIRCLGATQHAASTRPRGVCQWARLRITPYTLQTAAYRKLAKKSCVKLVLEL